MQKSIEERLRFVQDLCNLSKGKLTCPCPLPKALKVDQPVRRPHALDDNVHLHIAHVVDHAQRRLPRPYLDKVDVPLIGPAERLVDYLRVVVEQPEDPACAERTIRQLVSIE